MVKKVFGLPIGVWNPHSRATCDRWNAAHPGCHPRTPHPSYKLKARPSFQCQSWMAGTAMSPMPIPEELTDATGTSGDPKAGRRFLSFPGIIGLPRKGLGCTTGFEPARVLGPPESESGASDQFRHAHHAIKNEVRFLGSGLVQCASILSPGMVATKAAYLLPHLASAALRRSARAAQLLGRLSSPVHPSGRPCGLGRPLRVSPWSRQRASRPRLGRIVRQGLDRSEACVSALAYSKSIMPRKAPNIDRQSSIVTSSVRRVSLKP